MADKPINEIFFEVRDQKGDAFFCPLSSAGNIRPDLEACVGADVVERYAGNLELVSQSGATRSV